MLKVYVWWTTLPYLARLGIAYGGSIVAFLAAGFVLFMGGYS